MVTSRILSKHIYEAQWHTRIVELREGPKESQSNARKQWQNDASKATR